MAPPVLYISPGYLLPPVYPTPTSPASPVAPLSTVPGDSVRQSAAPVAPATNPTAVTLTTPLLTPTFTHTFHSLRGCLSDLLDAPDQRLVSFISRVANIVTMPAADRAQFQVGSIFPLVLFTSSGRTYVLTDWLFRNVSF